ncbi:MAG: hypothetical protein OEW15_06785 [Nitrospirota bacterium]|nr:hypothetical protein [Nitrospirota bacterium]
MKGKFGDIASGGKKMFFTKSKLSPIMKPDELTEIVLVFPTDGLACGLLLTASDICIRRLGSIEASTRNIPAERSRTCIGG